MRQIEVRIWIERPADEVCAYVVDFDRWPEWRSDVVGGELLTDGPMRVGTQARGIGRMFGRPFTIDVEVTTLEPGARFGYRPIKGPLKTNDLYTFETRDGGTMVVLTDDIGLNGIFKVFLPVMPALVRSGYRKNLAGLKAVLEAQPAHPPHDANWQRRRVVDAVSRQGETVPEGQAAPMSGPTRGGETRLHTHLEAVCHRVRRASLPSGHDDHRAGHSAATATTCGGPTDADDAALPCQPTRTPPR